jgi:hypothetical protein
MNIEKELLLALLIEKYATKPAAEVKGLNTTIYTKPVKKRQQRKPRHTWTNRQRELLFELKTAGAEWPEILKVMRQHFPAGNFNKASICNQHRDHLARMASKSEVLWND